MTEVSPYLFFILSLVVWRLTHLIQAEDGPFEVIYKIRKAAGEGMIGHLMDCFYCLSVWIAAPLGYYFANEWLHKFLLWLALSATAIILEKVTNNTKANNI